MKEKIVKLPIKPIVKTKRSISEFLNIIKTSKRVEEAEEAYKKGEMERFKTHKEVKEELNIQ